MMSVAARVAVRSAPEASSAATLAAPTTVSAAAGEPCRLDVLASSAAQEPPASRLRANSSRAAAFRQASCAPNALTIPAALTAVPAPPPRPQRPADTSPAPDPRVPGRHGPAAVFFGR